MSWSYDDSGIDKVQIWTNDAAGYSANGSLVVNGAHQVQLTVGITFSESTPTQEELLAAITLIDNTSGKDVTLFTVATEPNAASYLTIFNPPSDATAPGAPAPGAPAPGASATSDTLNYQYLINYYLSSSPATNPNNTGETVSLKVVVPIDETGTLKTHDFSSSGGEAQTTSVTIACDQPTIYSTSNVTLTKDTVDPQKTYTETTPTDDGTGSGWELGPFNLYRLRIKDDYLQFNDIKPQSGVKYVNTYTIGITGAQPSANHNEWGNVYDLTEREGMGSKFYTAQLYMDYDSSGKNWGYFTTPIVQGPAEYIFIRSNITVHTTDWSTAFLSTNVIYDAHDQFGTPITIEIKTTAGYPELVKVSQPSF